MGKKYDQLAYDFIRISLTAYSLTAILGGILLFTFLTLYPTFFSISQGSFVLSCTSMLCSSWLKAERCISIIMVGTG